MTMPSDLGRRARRRLPALVLALALMPAVARAQYVVREPMLQQFITDHDALVKSDAAALQRWSEAGYRTVDLQLVQSSVDIYLAGLRSMALGRQAEQLDCAAGVDQVYWEHLIAAETYTLLNRYCPRLVTLTGQAQGGEVPPVPPPSGGRPVATVAKAVGEVLVRTAGGDWRPLTGGSLGVNDEIATGVDASLTITFTDGTTLEYRELTRGLLSDVQTVEDRIKIRVLLKMGEIGAQVPKQETIRSDFSIKSPTLAASVRGTRFTVRYDTLTKVSTVAVQEGVVVVLPVAPGSHEIEVFRADVLAVGPAGARWVRQAAPATSPPPGAMPRPHRQPAAGAAWR
ncbi:MAG: FecR domain-containing protein, partial [Gemmatimonadetes bacterium]|nr:FecR domain-containing protein [Gemmatimonadota bacterium]